MTACDYLILGGGRAGLCAAEAIRKNDKTGSITMISDEAQLPYSRPMLTKLPLAFYEVEKTLVQPESWYQEQCITRLTQNKSSLHGRGAEDRRDFRRYLFLRQMYLCHGRAQFCPAISRERPFRRILHPHR